VNKLESKHITNNPQPLMKSMSEGAAFTIQSNFHSLQQKQKIKLLFFFQQMELNFI